MPKGDMEIIISVVTLTLLLIGMYIVYSASSPIGYLEHNGDSHYFFKKHVINALFAFVAFLVLRRINLKFLANSGKYLLLTSIILLIVVLFIPGQGGVKRWLSFGFFSVQPSEIVRFSLVIYLAYYLNKISKRGGEELKSWRRSLPLFVLIGIIFLLVSVEPHFGMAFIILITAIFIMWVGEMKLSHLLTTLVLAVPIFIILLFSRTYRMDRLYTFLNSGGAESEGGYQISQSLISLGSGGLWGKGLCSSQLKLFYLPEPHTDFVFAVLGEELGFIGALVAILLFFTLMVVGIRVAMVAKKRRDRLLAVGATLLIALPVLINLAMIMKLIPVVGIPLPFFSYGGTSLLITMSSAGILCNVANRCFLDRRERFQMYMEGKWGE